MTNEECRTALKRIAGYMCARKDLEALTHAMNVLEQEPRKITLEDVKGYCELRCLTIISNELLYELTHPKIKALEQEPRCKECKWWKDSDGEYRRGCGAESKCPINRREVFEGNGYCYLFEPQESEG